MITILSILEEGYSSSFEHLAFRQIKGAYGCGLVMVPHHYATMQEALWNTPGTKIFMVPDGRVAHSTDFDDFVLPNEDVVFVLGSPQENLVSYIAESDTALTIYTPFDVDMMAVCIAGIILHVYG